MNINNLDLLSTRPRRKWNAVLGIWLADSGTVVEPILLADAKVHLNIASAITDYDAIITKFIKQARATIEQRRGIVLIKKTVTVHVRNELGNQILPYGPFLTLTTIKDADDVAIPVDSYRIEGNQFPWIESPTYPLIKIVYESGYNGVLIPHDIVKEVYTELAWLFSNRGDEVHEKNHSGVWLI